MHTSSGCGFWVSWSHGCPRDVSPSWRSPGRGERGPLCLTLPPSWQGLPGSGTGVAAEGDGQQPADPAHLALPQRADRPLALAGQLLLPGPAGGHLPVRTATSTCHSTGTRLGMPTGCAGLTPIPWQSTAHLSRCEGPTFPWPHPGVPSASRPCNSPPLPACSHAGVSLPAPFPVSCYQSHPG